MNYIQYQAQQELLNKTRKAYHPKKLTDAQYYFFKSIIAFINEEPDSPLPWGMQRTAKEMWEQIK